MNARHRARVPGRPGLTRAEIREIEPTYPVLVLPASAQAQQR